jgi:hypothetical protein
MREIHDFWIFQAKSTPARGLFPLAIRCAPGKVFLHFVDSIKPTAYAYPTWVNRFTTHAQWDLSKYCTLLPPKNMKKIQSVFLKHGKF